LLPAPTEAPARVIVLNYDPAAEGLLGALHRLYDGPRLDLLCVGAAAPAEIEPHLAGRATYLQGAIDRGLEHYTALLAGRAAVTAARAVIVLPRHAGGEVDANSRLICAAIRRACGALKGPAVVVAIEDPEASFEFAGLGVTTIFYPGFLRAALFAHACVDLAVFRFILGLLHGRVRVLTIPVPAHLRAATFRAATLALEEAPDGAPLTLIGVFDGAGAGAGLRLNPGPGYSLAEVACLLALTAAELTDVA
jgi:hypothetical protein